MDKRIKANVDTLRQVAQDFGLELRRRALKSGNGHQQWELFNPRTGCKRNCTVSVSPSDANYLRSARRAAVKKARELNG